MTVFDFNFLLGTEQLLAVPAAAGPRAGRSSVGLQAAVTVRGLGRLDRRHVPHPASGRRGWSRLPARNDGDARRAMLR